MHLLHGFDGSRRLIALYSLLSLDRQKIFIEPCQNKHSKARCELMTSLIGSLINNKHRAWGGDRLILKKSQKTENNSILIVYLFELFLIDQQ